MSLIEIKKHSLFLAPMESVTDENFRRAIHKCHPEWDYYATDFLRCPTAGKYPDKKIVTHFGEQSFLDPEQKRKTIYQILTSPKADTATTVRQIIDHGFEWLDLNIGCPSKTVCKNKGGSSLLAHPDELKRIISEIRNLVPTTFTCKIRVGYQDDLNFLETLNILEGEGVDAITIHARTRNQMYKGVANWDYIKLAVEQCNIPIIANGDIWSKDDVAQVHKYTNCRATMLARPALNTLWMPRLIKNKQEENLGMRKKEITTFFNTFYEMMSEHSDNERGKLKRLKAISRYCFDPFEGQNIKTSCLRSKSLAEFNDVLNQIEV